MAKNLLFFTGGVDSTYLAYKLLTDTTDDVTLLVVASQTDNADGLGKQKILNMQPVITELRKIREMPVKYLKVEDSDITSFDLDRWNIYAMTKLAADFNNGTYDRLVSGTSWEQMDGKFFKHSEVRGLSTHLDGPGVWSQLTTRGELWNPLITHEIHQNYNRWHVLKYLPDNLMQHNISCDTGAREPNKCNVCDKCGFNNRVKDLMSKGYTASDVDEWRREKSYDYSGSTSRDCNWRSWIKFEEAGRLKTKKGLAEDVPADLVIPEYVTTKDEFRTWYSTIEWNPRIDYGLMKWGLTKDDWVPPTS
jgi:hypothetical protein